MTGHSYCDLCQAQTPKLTAVSLEMEHTEMLRMLFLCRACRQEQPYGRVFNDAAEAEMVGMRRLEGQVHGGDGSFMISSPNEERPANRLELALLNVSLDGDHVREEIRISLNLEETDSLIRSLETARDELRQREVPDHLPEHIYSAEETP